MTKYVYCRPKGNVTECEIGRTGPIYYFLLDLNGAWFCFEQTANTAH